MSCQSRKRGWSSDHVGRFTRCLSLVLAGTLGLVSPSAAWAGRAVAHGLSAGDAIVARVPFRFLAGARAFPAGSYRVSWRMPGILVIRDVTESDDVPLSVTNRLRPRNDSDQNEPTIVFTRLRRGYVLSEIWFSGYGGFGVESPDSSFRAGLEGGPDPITTADARAAKLP